MTIYLSILPQKNFGLIQISFSFLKALLWFSPPDVGPSARSSLNLVTVGYVRPDVCPRKEMFFLPGKPTANKSPPTTPITRSQYFRKKRLLLHLTKTIQTKSTLVVRSVFDRLFDIRNVQSS